MLKPFLNGYFTFTRGERRGVIALLCILFLTLTVPRLYLILSKNDNNVESLDKSEFFFFAGQLEASSDKGLRDSLFFFDPNTASDKDFETLGLSSRQIRNIKNYISAGGVFRSAEDLLRMYTIDSSLYANLEPYIQIGSQKQQTGLIFVESDEGKAIAPVIEVNDADENLLMQLKGIGSVYSTRIVNYRNLLGGYVCTGQLRDVYGIDEELYLEIEPYVFADTAKIDRINLNTAEFGSLLRHPYLDYNQVSAIFSYRDSAGLFLSVCDLNLLERFSQEEVERVRPYLRVK